jgi:hypothetical protein
MGFSGSRQFLLKPICYSLPKIKRFKTHEVFFASPKFHVHRVEVESFVFLALKLFLGLRTGRFTGTAVEILSKFQTVRPGTKTAVNGYYGRFSCHHLTSCK